MDSLDNIIIISNENDLIETEKSNGKFELLADIPKKSETERLDFLIKCLGRR